MVEPSKLLGCVRASLRARSPELWAVAFAVAWFFYLGFGSTLDPSSVAWMWHDDWSAYQWGFSFFRNADWSWPLGNVANLFYPRGTSVGFTDANPWMCVLFKLLSPLPPIDFQFSGMWFLLCYALQALFGTFACKSMTRDPVQLALGGALFAVTPVLPMRAPHIALCALFFVTAGLWLNLRRGESLANAQRGILISLALLAWAAGTHAYLSAMLLVLCVAYYVRLSFVDRLIGPRALLASACAAFAVTLVVYYLFGFIGWKDTELSVEGFGRYSADLLTLFNSQGLSRFVPGFPLQPWQWEGFAYLGLGGLLLLGLLVIRVLAEPVRWWRSLTAHWPLVVATLLMFVYALSSRVTLRGELVLDLTPWYASLGELAGVFRSSGRFAWPLHLLLLAAGIRAVASDRHRVLARLVLALAVALGVAEQDRQRLRFDPVQLPRLSDVWKSVAGDYSHLAIIPLQSQWDCPYNALLVDTLSYEAYRQKLTFNSGNFMRKEPGTKALCDKGVTEIDLHTIYVVELAHLAAFQQRGAVCGVLDGLVVCVRGERTTMLRDVLAQRPMTIAK